jgi:predicted GTPase
VKYFPQGKKCKEKVVTYVVQRKRINILICGNHSSGKSSFINWYVGEHIQKTGVAIETQGVTLVQSGKRRETLEGPATVNLHPKLQDIARERGLMENLSTEVSISQERKFPLVTFIDSPGLVDGTTHYPFDVEKVLKFLADQSDLVFVFFDPVGQALCKRTMNVVELLNSVYHEKMRFILSKADAVDSVQDLQKVLVQVTQNLSMIVRNKNFELQTIYLPNVATNTSVPNALEDVCKEIEKTINANVQRSLNQLETDCNKLKVTMDTILSEDQHVRSRNASARNKGLCLILLGLILPVLFLMSFVNTMLMYGWVQPEQSIYPTVKVMADIGKVVNQFYKQQPTNFLGGMIGLLLVCLLLSKCIWKYKPVLAKADVNKFSEQKKFLNKTVLKQKEDLYQQYFKQFVSDLDSSE